MLAHEQSTHDPDGHRFEPNSGVLMRGELREEFRKVLGFTVRRTVFVLGCTHSYTGPTLHIEAHEGYATDGATIPRILWWLFERFGKHARAALYHDILYDHRRGHKVTADAAMLEIMLVDRVWLIVAVPIFLAVLLWPMNWWHWYGPRRPRRGASEVTTWIP